MYRIYMKIFVQGNKKGKQVGSEAAGRVGEGKRGREFDWIVSSNAGQQKSLDKSALDNICLT